MKNSGTEESLMAETAAKNIREAALKYGFEDCGIITPDRLEGFRERFARRIQRVPESEEMYRGVGDVGHALEQYPWAKAMVICTYWYGQYRYPQQLQGHYAKAFALAPNGKQGCRPDLFEKWLKEQGMRVEGSGAPLRYAAWAAGLGIIRKNNFFYTEKGSYYYLYGYMIDRECELIKEAPDLPSCSDKCGLCRKACRPRALVDEYTLNPTRCVAYWTSLGKGVVPDWLEDSMYGEWLCGCDDCQDACPYNRKHDWSKGEAYGELDEIADRIGPENIENLSDEYIREHIIAISDNHQDPEDVSVVRGNAKRAMENRNRGKEESL